MSFSYSGYVPETIDEIFIRMSAELKSVLPSINLNPDNLVYQWLKGEAKEKYYLQQNILDATNNITPISASGVFLDKHGIERGIKRKKAAFANGEVLATWVPDNTIVPEGSKFATANSKSYVSTEPITFVDKLVMTRLGGSQDDIPSGFKNLYLSGFFSDADYETWIDGSFYSYANDIVTWSNTGYLASGANYYVTLSGTMGAYVPVQCDTIGTYGNTASNTITINSDGLANITTVTNEADVINGREVEDDETFRRRILAANGKTFTLENVSSLVGDIVGVKNVSVYQTPALDKSTLTDFDAQIVNCTGVYPLEGTGWYGFSFYPSTGIATIKQFKLYGKVSGFAPDLQFNMYQYTSGAVVTGGTALATYTITREFLNRDYPEEWQDITVPMKYNGIENIRTYQVAFHHTEQPTSGYWILAITGAMASNYRLDSFSGLATLQPSGFIIRTYYGAPSYNIDVIPYSNYIFETDIKPEIEAILDNETGGYSPIAIGYNITEATKVYLNLRGTLTLYVGYTLANVVLEAKENITKYLEELDIGEDVVYSQVEHAIMGAKGVKRLTNLQMRINDGTWITRNEERDLAIALNEYVVLDNSAVYDGVQLT